MMASSPTTAADSPGRPGGTYPAGAPRSLRDLNRLHVIDVLRKRGSASRSELVRLTGLSRTTITALVADLPQLAASWSSVGPSEVRGRFPLRPAGAAPDPAAR